jgi:hypothetical protein
LLYDSDAKHCGHVVGPRQPALSECGLARPGRDSLTIKKTFRPGADVMLFKIFSPKNLAKIFLLKLQQLFCKKIDHNIGF